MKTAQGTEDFYKRHLPSSFQNECILETLSVFEGVNFEKTHLKPGEVDTEDPLYPAKFSTTASGRLTRMKNFIECPNQRRAVTSAQRLLQGSDVELSSDEDATAAALESHADEFNACKEARVKQAVIAKMIRVSNTQLESSHLVLR